MNTYSSLIKVTITKTITTNTKVLVEAQDAYKAKLQLEAMYGKVNLIGSPQLVR